MARTRLDSPGALHHVTARGIERRAIFLDDQDRSTYLSHLTRALADSGTQVLAWALMDNHVHLLIRTGSRPLAASMQILGSNYARYFNRKRERRGYVFQDRYDSRLVDEDAYLLAAIRYIHLNPLDGGLVRSLRELGVWPWSGHSSLMGGARHPFQAVGPVLSLFHDDVRQARIRLLEWMGADDSADYGSLRAGTGSSETGRSSRTSLHRNAGVVGSIDFAREALRDLSQERARLASRQRRWNTTLVVDHVCRAFGVEPEAVRSGRRTRPVSRARAAAAFLAHRELEQPLAAIAPDLGVTISALSRSIEQGRQIAAEEALSLD